MSFEPSPEDIEAATPRNGSNGHSTEAPSRASEPPVRRSEPKSDPIRLLPSAPDSEKGILCACMILPDVALIACSEGHLAPEHFNVPAHRTVYDVILDLWESKKPINPGTVAQLLRDKNRLDEVGGAAFIGELGLATPTAANVEYDISVVKGKFKLRTMIEVGTRFAMRGYVEQYREDELLDEFEEAALAIRKDDNAQVTFKTAKELAQEVVSDIEEMYERRGAVTGIETGLKELDHKLNGLQRSDMIVVAARPSMGKTALAMNIASHVAIVLKLPVAVFSLEMSDKQLMQRAILSLAKVNAEKVRTGFLAERDFPALTHAACSFAESKLQIVDAPGWDINDLRATARRLKRKFGSLGLVVIDYLQLVRSRSRQAQNNREREVSEVSAGCKAMAKELECPVIVLAQLNRDVEKRTGEAKGRPRLSDLRESGSIEQDADVVGLLWREEYYAENEEDKRSAEGKAELIIAKQRNGPIGEIPLTFLKEFSQFEQRARMAEPEPRDYHQ